MRQRKWSVVIGMAVGGLFAAGIADGTQAGESGNSARRFVVRPAQHEEAVETAQNTQSSRPAGSRAYVSRPIQEIAPTVAEEQDGKLPDELVVPRRGTEDRQWEGQVFSWEASQLYHYPLYFEDMPLERYGHSLGLLQPIWSVGQFYGNVALLPYEAGMNPPFRPRYSLGHHRPGDCVPRLWYQVPVSVQGAVTAATTWTLLPVIYP